MAENVAQSKAGIIRLRVFGRTDVGRVREHNEDNFLVADLTRKSRSLLEGDRVQVVGERGTVLAVCDGMGGAAAGEVASDLAVGIIYQNLLEGSAPANRDDLARCMIRAVEAAGLRIFNEAKADRQHRGMGTTCTVASLIDAHLFLAQVGDSRGYILRKGRLVQVTRDQSLVNQLIEAGQLTEEEAENFEHNNIILQALGTSDSVQVDLTFVELKRDDVLMLCSDGLSGMVRYDDIREVLAGNDDPFEACKVLVDKANQAGGHDNITCIVARFDGDGLCPVKEGDEPLRYAKYAFPPDSSLPPTVQTWQPARQPSERPASNPDFDNRITDHGPTRSGLAHTVLAMQSPLTGAAAELGLDEDGAALSRGSQERANLNADDAVELPVRGAPLWVLGAIVLGVFGAILALAFYLMSS